MRGRAGQEWVGYELTATSMGSLRRGIAGTPRSEEEGLGEPSERIMSKMRSKRCSIVKE